MIWGIIQGLGLGESLLGAAILLLAAFYLLRGLRLAGTAGVVVSSGVMYLVVTAVVLAFALALGWLDPRPGVIQHTISTVQGFVRTVVVDWLGGLVREVGL
jgi:hypothetical protein